MASRDEMIRQLKRQDMISQLKARDSQTSDPTGEGAATLAAEEKYKSEAPSAAEAAGIGSLQGVTRNWGDELMAKASTLTGGDYEANKHKIQQRDLRSKDEQPLAYYGANLPTAIATSVGPGGIAKQAALAGVDGVTRSLGDADKIDEKSVSESVKTGTIDAATAGALAKVAPGLVSKAGEYGERGADWLKKFANGRAVKALEGTKGQVEKLGDKADEVGAMLLDNKVVTPWASNKTMAKRLEDQGAQVAKDMTPIYEQSSGMKITSDELEDMIRHRASGLKEKAGSVKVGNQVNNYADDVKTAKAPADKKILEYIEKGGDYEDVVGKIPGATYNPTDLKDFRVGVQNGIDFNSDAVSQEGAKSVRSLLREAEMGLIEKADPALRVKNEKLFKDYHLTSLAEDMADKGAAKSAVNNDIGLNTFQTGTQAAAAGLTNGLSILPMAAKEFFRRYGNQMSAVTANKVSKAMTSSKFSPAFEKAAKQGPSAIAAVHAALLGNPEYKALVGDE